MGIVTNYGVELTDSEAFWNEGVIRDHHTLLKDLDAVRGKLRQIRTEMEQMPSIYGTL